MVATNGVNMSAPDSRQIKLRVIGTADLNRSVRASVFASKLASLVRAVEAADKSANGTKTFEFVIADLKPSSAMAIIEERRANKIIPRTSSIDTFGRCLMSVESGRFEFARQHIECTRQIASIAKDVTETFDSAELTANGFNLVVIDPPFLRKISEAIVLPQMPKQEQWFKGTTLGSLDGTIVTESIASGVTTMALRLSVGGALIECDCSAFTSVDIAPFFGRRVRVSGRIHYKGDTGLPHKVELLELPKAVKANPDFGRWEGALRASEGARGWNS